MCLIGLAAGLKFSKVLGLSWEGINFNQKILRVNRSFDHSYSRKFKDTKSDTSKRTIVIDEPTINLLKEYKQANRSRHPNYIFLDTNLDNVTNNAVNKVLRRACARANIQEISFHFLRHTHCSILLFQGISIHYVSKLKD
ncbi:site-specific integrase [Dolosigranulum pigrum]|uniref:site-specific integrase n=1 Tax=Dolosigranulum pigrum TaxID=29394 RepID=UPI001AD88BCB|nr:site-specific integrase [Dolosigranulum pigrum]QTJ38778.1 site-specific integrase [Dolosigranulum pigrum]